MDQKKKNILYVDDDVDDRELLGEVMEKISPQIDLTFAHNGLIALELLENAIESNELPCLIVLDLNMPFLTGRQTFEKIKAAAALQNIPIVILSSGESPADKSFFRDKGIPYFMKPIRFLDMEKLAGELTMHCS